jgi:hypothetical protein
LRFRGCDAQHAHDVPPPAYGDGLLPSTCFDSFRGWALIAPAIELFATTGPFGLHQNKLTMNNEKSHLFTVKASKMRLPRSEYRWLEEKSLSRHNQQHMDPLRLSGRALNA